MTTLRLSLQEHIDRLSKRHRTATLDWFREQLRAEIGAQCPKDDADIVIVALARGYECHTVQRYAEPSTLEVRRHGQVLAQTTMPGLFGMSLT